MGTSPQNEINLEPELGPVDLFLPLFEKPREERIHRSQGNQKSRGPNRR